MSRNRRKIRNFLDGGHLGINKHPLPQMKEHYITRKQLAIRWNCSTETIKRKERSGYVKPFKFGQRFVRYRLADIEQLEREACAC